DVTVLINNAGVLASFNVLTTTKEQMARDFDTNFFGTLAATKAFLPALERAAGGGEVGEAGEAAIVNLLSIASLASVPALAAYSA
ncbi:SDR family NAD(P)-dependent oxidoreductase, partial [Escherichia coli]|uniref:SDR family NAD(P)-dependent oxidoreductase n=1 Tax=Escherichia coli TaxID=562 RepID=UPI00159BB5E6